MLIKTENRIYAALAVKGLKIKVNLLAMVCGLSVTTHAGLAGSGVKEQVSCCEFHTVVGGHSLCVMI